MTYTRAWDETQPLGTAARNTVDDIFRNLKVDLRERFETGLIVDYDADPVVTQPAILGNVTGKLLNLHWSAFTLGASSNWQLSVGGAYIEDTNIASELFAPLMVPAGCTLTECLLYANPLVASAMKFNIVRTIKTSGSISDVFAEVSTTGTVYAEFTSGALSHVVDSAYLYFCRVTTNAVGFNGNRLYGMAIKYNTPDTRNTL